MKTNLKTFPSKTETQEELQRCKKLGLKYIRYDMVRLGLIEKWKHDFEAELREIINENQSWHPLPSEETIILIKEILGE